MPSNRQLSFVHPEALSDWVSQPGADFGEVFTRRWVADFVLDLVGYKADVNLGKLRLVEPSCGSGAFLVPVVERLLESCNRFGVPVESTGSAIAAFDLLVENVLLARKEVVALLTNSQVAFDVAERLAACWVNVGDFLLTDHEHGSADFVVGNPPYIRLEGVPAEVTAAYRRACPTMRGRSDVYIGFFEIGLDLLKPNGTLGFICADRWMHNQYGADLRDLVTSSYSVDAVVTMHDVDAFEDEVSAYPAITVISNAPQATAYVVDAKRDFDSGNAATVTKWIGDRKRRTPSSKSFDASRLDRWFTGKALWPSGTPKQLELLADLERRFPLLENQSTGTKVGIGVATGCDEIYITKDASLVEEDRLLPMLLAGDLNDGTPQWSGNYLVNPWTERGLVDLKKYPLLRRYLTTNEERLRTRHTAQKNPDRWYRTIDTVDPGLQARPKLLLPDLKAAAHPVLDEGRYYPHHNTYFVVSDSWDLEVLGGLLLSDFTNLFVGAYCVKMRGGCYRFQAQYLRQIRVPEPAALSATSRTALTKAFRSRDRVAATAAAAIIYGVCIPN
jgi:adenine-specific DNA-methyltransferase